MTIVRPERPTPTLTRSLRGMVPRHPAISACHSADGVKDVARASMASAAAAMRYRDVAAASDWLCAAFGFQKHLVATSETGVVHYAQLTFGDAMFLLAPVRDTALDTYMKQPDAIGGAETQCCYLSVGDADAHYATAKAAGAEIIVDLQNDDFGGRSYACRDPEGHIWNFGTYDPWQGKRAPRPPLRQPRACAAPTRTGPTGLRRPPRMRRRPPAGQ